MEALIIGAGVIGLSIGWQLQRAGISCAIVDAGGKRASSVAAGMLAPYSESSLQNPGWLAMAKTSLALYPEFLQELSQESGQPIALVSSGTLLVAMDSDDVNWLQATASQKRKQEIAFEFLCAEAARTLEPLLSPKVVMALWIKEEAHVDAPLLMQALRKAYMRKGGVFFSSSASRHHSFPTRQTIVCAGAYSNCFGAPIRPIKGEILTLKNRAQPLRCMVRTPRVYLVSKTNGALRIGATSSEMGYDLSFSGAAFRMLLQEAWTAVPSVDDMEILSCEVGLRPAGINPMPLIGKKEGILFATGHGRSGILLAPYTAKEMMKIILNGEEKEMACEKLADLMPQQSGVAAALNGVVIPGTKWKETLLKEGDSVDQVIPFQGG
jgi:glycine oxidase